MTHAEELLRLQEDFSERSFSAGWFCDLEQIIDRLMSGESWPRISHDLAFDGDSCPPPPPGELARMMFLIGSLGGYWGYGRKWVTLPSRRPSLSKLSPYHEGLPVNPDLPSCLD